MLLTLSTTHEPATDLGYLLHKNPSRIHTVEMAFGIAKVFYSEAGARRCTVVIALEVDPVRLVRGGGLVGDYVNDRPYVASSFLSSAVGRLFGTAMTGRSKERPELAEAELPFEVHLPVVRGSDALLRRMFEPLGYTVESDALTLDERFPSWGASPYRRLTLRTRCRLADLLAHLYVLIPTLDASKHYYVAKDEVEKLLRRGKGWLAAHPHREEIAQRYLVRDRALTREAMLRLLQEEGVAAPDGDPLGQDETSDSPPDLDRAARAPSLHDLRLETVAQVLRAEGVRRVLDLGCGEGRLLRLLLADPQFREIVGVDVAYAALQKATRRLKLDQASPKQLARIRLFQSSLVYRDRRLEGFDGAAVVEVVEHLDPGRLRAFERALFEFAKPSVVVLTTPNKEFNILFEGMEEGAMRHQDHRFEWTRSEFADWARRVAQNHGYTVDLRPIGPEHPELGAPSQMGVFRRAH
ncbi:MAG: 3' terminal RNA ribose 2'-O-methyltransferase Hen1 [Chthonomonas sp.]